jgi:hypothetical protein
MCLQNILLKLRILGVRRFVGLLSSQPQLGLRGELIHIHQAQALTALNHRAKAANPRQFPILAPTISRKKGGNKAGIIFSSIGMSFCS